MDCYGTVAYPEVGVQCVEGIYRIPSSLLKKNSDYFWLNVQFQRSHVDQSVSAFTRTLQFCPEPPQTMRLGAPMSV